jgi:hypothetical protein
MFDGIYWTFIDHRYYGTFTSRAGRVRLWGQEQQQEMNELVRITTNQYTKDENFEDYYPIDKLLNYNYVFISDYVVLWSNKWYIGKTT